jgi:hypothetical protein
MHLTTFCDFWTAKKIEERLEFSWRNIYCIYLRMNLYQDAPPSKDRSRARDTNITLVSRLGAHDYVYQ